MDEDETVDLPEIFIDSFYLPKEDEKDDNIIDNKKLFDKVYAIDGDVYTVEETKEECSLQEFMIVIDAKKREESDLDEDYTGDITTDLRPWSRDDRNTGSSDGESSYHQNLTIRETPHGILINSILLIPTYNWHTITSDGDFSCLVCATHLTVPEDHVKHDTHRDNLEQCQPLENLGFNIIRKIHINYHCGICDLILNPDLLEEHIVTKEHENRMLFATKRASHALIDCNDLNEKRFISTSDDDCLVDNNINHDNSDIFQTTVSNDSALSKSIDDIFSDSEAGIKFDAWHMIVTPKKDEFYCMVCVRYEDIHNKTKHCLDVAHLDKLSRCAVLEEYKKYCVRKLDEKYYHCGSCNSLMYNHDIQNHIQLVHVKSKMKRRKKRENTDKSSESIYVSIEDLSENHESSESNNDNYESDENKNIYRDKFDSNENRSINSASDDNQNKNHESEENVNINHKSGDNLNSDLTSNENLNSNVVSNENVNSNLASAKNLNTNLASDENLNANLTSGKNVNANLASGEKANANLASGENVNSNLASARNVNANLASGEKANANLASGDYVNANPASGENVNANLAIGDKANANRAPGENLNSNPASGENLNANVATGENVNANLASDEKANANLASGVNPIFNNQSNLHPVVNNPEWILNQFQPGMFATLAQYKIDIYQFFCQIRVSLIAYHMVCWRQSDYYCGVCNVASSELDMKIHISDVLHTQRLRYIPFEVYFNVNLIRRIDKYAHCTICNLVFELPLTFAHVMDQRHRILLSEATQTPPAPINVIPNYQLRHSNEYPIAPAMNQAKNLEVNESQTKKDSYKYEFVYLKFKNKYYKICFKSYNSLISVGDGTFYCFVCSEKVFESFQEHVQSEGHTSKLEQCYFLDDYDRHLFRQISYSYHCCQCNAIFTKSELEKHLTWPCSSMKASRKIRKLDLNSGVKKIDVKTRQEFTVADEPESTYEILIQIDIKSEEESRKRDEVFDSEIVKEDKVIVFEGKAVIVAWDAWQGLCGSKDGRRCVMCQRDVNAEDINLHVTEGRHEDLLESAFEKKYLPSLLRWVNKSLLHCLTCNKEVLSKDNLISEHVNGKKHKKNLIINKLKDIDRSGNTKEFLYLE